MFWPTSWHDISKYTDSDEKLHLLIHLTGAIGYFAQTFENDSNIATVHVTYIIKWGAIFLIMLCCFVARLILDILCRFWAVFALFFK